NIDFTWDFGNGETFNGDTPPPVSYTSAGTYTLQVFAENQSTNCRDTLILNNLIQVGLPIDYLFAPKQGCDDLEVRFRDQSLAAADSVRWDFGDGNTANTPNANHVYEEPGCYEVSLTRFTDGCPSMVVFPECIPVFETPVASSANDRPSGCELPHEVNFTGMASTEIASWSWDFGDATTSAEQNPTHTYDTFGIYPVRLAVESIEGCVDTIVMDTIRVIETIAVLDFENIGGCTPYTFTLEENSNTASDIIAWNWEILDVQGNSVFNSDLPNPTATLSQVGYYDVVLTVSNSFGCSSTQTFPGVIGVGNAVTADFDANPQQTCINSAVSFTDQSLGDVDFWIWDFGDGGTAEGIQNPMHEYKDTGFFTVTLFAFDNGCVSELIQENYIYVAPPVGAARLTFDCDQPETVGFE
ncbi:MAG: PKD domain-containing protein, partial [Bacteroidota bacterium]